LTTDREGSSFYFGPFQLDPQAAELRRDGHRIELRPKCLQLLLLLVEKSGKLLSREVLLEQIWSDVVVGQETLSRTITEIRQALSDSSEAPQYIETVPRYGYKFIAPVTRAHRATTYSLFIAHRYQEYPLPEGDHLIGRGQDVAVHLYTPLISRHHARIRVRGSELTLEDLGSKNGTLVNGVRVNGTVELQSGDSILVGGELLIVRSATDSTTTAGMGGADRMASR
jgi:DNA-binding winged helix-turn-helix (wHTH) protein